ncbi:MAG: tetratricopeptide repeat protein [Bauldia sp.]
MRRFLLFAILALIPAAASADFAADDAACRNEALGDHERVEACGRAAAVGAGLPQKTADLWIRRAGLNIGLEQTDAALADFEAAIGAAPDYAAGYAGRARLFFDLDRYEEAVPDLEAAVRLLPDDLDLKDDLGYAYYYVDRYDEAIAVFDEAIHADPDDIFAIFIRGVIRFEREEFDLALADIEATLALDPRYARVIEYRGRVHEALGDLDAAIRDYRVATLLDPNLLAPLRLDEIVTAEQAGDITTRLTYTPPPAGLRITYLEVRNAEDTREEIEIAIGELIGFFNAGPVPLPLAVNNTRTVIEAVAGDVITVTTGPDGEGKTGATEDVFRVFFLMRPPPEEAPPFPVRVDYDEGMAAFWQTAPGETTTGIGRLLIECPAAANPLTTILGCSPGAATAGIGRVDWTATFEGWEYVVVPAGRRLVARIAYSDRREIVLFAQIRVTENAATYWYDPSIGWWIKREETRDGRVTTAEALTIEMP